MACNVLIHRLKPIRKSASKKNYAVKTNACGCKTHRILVLDITHSFLSGKEDITLQYELCKTHAAKLECEGIDFFNNPEVINQTPNPNAISEYYKTSGSRYRRFPFSGFYRNIKVNNYKLLIPETTVIPSKRIQRRNAVKDRIKRMMNQSNTKLLTDQDWYDAMELALKEHMIEQVMKS